MASANITVRLIDIASEIEGKVKESVKDGNKCRLVSPYFLRPTSTPTIQYIEIEDDNGKVLNRFRLMISGKTGNIIVVRQKISPWPSFLLPESDDEEEEIEEVKSRSGKCGGQVVNRPQTLPTLLPELSLPKTFLFARDVRSRGGAGLATYLHRAKPGVAGPTMGATDQEPADLHRRSGVPGIESQRSSEGKEVSNVEFWQELDRVVRARGRVVRLNGNTLEPRSA